MIVLAAVGMSPVGAVAECGAEIDGELGFGSAKGAVLKNHHRLHPLLEIVQFQVYQILTCSWVVQNDKAVPVVVVPVCQCNPVEKLKNLVTEPRIGTYFPQFLLAIVQGEWVQGSVVQV